LIEVKWKHAKKLIVYFLLLPYLFYLIFFMIYTIDDLQAVETVRDRDLEKYSEAIRVIVLFFTGYFLLFEILQWIYTGVEVLKDFWNYIDMS